MKRTRRRPATPDLHVIVEGGEPGPDGVLSPAVARFLDYLIDRAIEDYLRGGEGPGDRADATGHHDADRPSR